MKSKRMISASLASIFADGSHVTLALIYKDASHDSRDTLLDEFDSVRDQALFMSSENGWTFDLLVQ
jgi:hypothetical protein